MAFTLNKQAVARPTSSAARASRSRVVVCKAQANVDRRQVLSTLAASVPLLAASPAFAAFGDSANVFGRVTNQSGFIPYAGEGFGLALPSKWNPSKERDFDNIVLRYEDNGDAVNNMLVIVEKTDKNSIEAFGSPEKFLESYSYLLGRQAWQGETLSEGGFAPGRVSAANVLDVAESTDKKGKTYYELEILTKTADGNEGGRHQLIKATVSNGQLYIMKVQIGDKRWFKGASKDAKGLIKSFTVA